MKSSIVSQIKPFLGRGFLPALLATALLSLGATSSVQAGGNHHNLPAKSIVIPPAMKIFGKSYGEWSAAWWQWAMEHPVAGHPFVDDPAFDVSSGQSGPVWFLGSPFGTVQREVTVPYGKILFAGMLNAEASDIEYGTVTEDEQRELANWYADHIQDVSCKVNGRNIPLMSRFRAESPQFEFIAPDPWIFSPVPGGEGTAVADGYYIMVALLTPGRHTIQYTGKFVFTLEADGFDQEFGLDTTYVVNVARPCQ